jgi:sideroflexin-1/3
LKKSLPLISKIKKLMIQVYTNTFNLITVIPPLVMNTLERRNALAKIPWANAPLQVVLCGFCLTFATPMCCALFPQKASIAVADLEPDLKVTFSFSQNEPNLHFFFTG